MRKILVAVVAALFPFASATADTGGFPTSDPLRAFVHEEYALGSDYFINGTGDTVLFRCLLPTAGHSFEGIALSERSIWGNRGGDWEVFRKAADGSFVYVGTGRLADTACLESCQSREYLSTGRCTWRSGWPQPTR